MQGFLSLKNNTI